MNGDEGQRVDRVLAALNDAKPEEGMEQRIMTRLHRAQGAVHGRGTRLALPRFAFACVAIAFLSASVWQGLRNELSPRKQHAANGKVSTKQAAKEAGTGGKTARAASAASSPLWVHGDLKAGAPSSPRTSQVSTAAGNHAARSDGGPEVAPSFPAPPEPLTEQERLLLRLAHRGDPVQLASLAPTAFEAEFQREKEHVQEFFAEPLPVDQ